MSHGEHEKAAKTEHTPEPTDIHSPFNACMYRGHCKGLEKQRDELLAALEFYADPIRYRGPNQLSDGTDKFTPCEMCYVIDVTRDCGNIAKTAIASVKEKA